MRRRDVALALCSLAVVPGLAAADSTASRGPLFWRARRGNTQVFLLGFGEAKNRSWFTPTIREAFEQSPAVWVETGPPTEHIRQLFDQHGSDPGRTFFDALPPAVQERAERYVAELKIDRKSIEHMRPWRAYYVFASAYAARQPAAEWDNPEQVLLDLATKAGKHVRYEFPNADSLVRFFINLPAEVQSQYFAWLLDYFDADKEGRNEADAWLLGQTESASLSLDRMRRYSQLYRAMQPERNRWWAHQIRRLLDAEGASFVAVGLLHVLGPDGIPRQLQDMGINLRESAEFQ